MSNRILDYPEATEITSDDYILLDSEGTGAKCIKASALNINMDNYTIKEARGSIASFDDGEDLPLAFMGCYIEPQQDLHGYDYPWVGGSGRNLFNMGSKVDGTIANITYTSDDEYLYMNGTKQGGGYADLTVLQLTLPAGTYYLKAITISGTASNSVELYPYDGSANLTSSIINTERILTLEEEKTFRFRFAIWTDGTVLNNYKLGIVISKTANIDKFYPYSNECPISGWSGANVSVCGKNLFYMTNDNNINAYLDGNNNKIITNSGHTCYYFPCKANVTYTVSKTATATNGRLGIAYSYEVPTNNLPIYGTQILNSFVVGQRYSLTTTTDASAKYIIVWAYWGADEDSKGSIQLEFGSEPTTFTPYDTNSHTYTIPFTDAQGNPITVYGGECDVVNGVLTVTHGRDLGSSLNWSDYGSNNIYYAEISSKKAGFENLLMSDYSYFSGTYANMPNGTFKGSGNTKYIYIRDDRYSSATEFKNNITTSIVYELTVPLTYQLSKQQIRSLVGVNNIFADTGEVIVDYRKLWVMPEM